MDSEEGLAFLVEFVESRRPDLAPIAVDTDLLRDGIIESLTLVELLSTLEERWGREISLEDVSAGDMRTLSGIHAALFNAAKPAVAGDGAGDLR